MTRIAEIKTAILRKLSKVPAGYMSTQEHLVNDIQLVVAPSPSRTEIETALKELDALYLVAGMVDDYDGEMHWKITIAGKMELSMH